MIKKIALMMAGYSFLLVTPGWAAPSVLLTGDSMMKAIAPTFEMKLAGAGFTVHSSAAIGTGLARLDLFDWHMQITSSVREYKPEIAIVMLGGNDNQPMRTESGIVPFGAAEWSAEYANRVGKFLDLMSTGGVKRIYWLEAPAMRDSQLNADVQIINQIARQEVAKRKQVFFETRLLLSKTPAGAYSAYVIQANGMPLHVRLEDGMHLNRKGAEWLADRLIPVLQSSNH